MARDSDTVSADERVRRSVGRTLGNMLFYFLLVPGIALGLAWYSHYQLEPGQSAIILRFGAFESTVSETGLHFHLPPPIEVHEIVNVTEVELQEFGLRTAEDKTVAARHEAIMQTGDNNIVQVSFAVSYVIKDAVESRYSLEDPEATLRDAAQAALREEVGRRGIDEIISQGRGELGDVARLRLQTILDGYAAGLSIDKVALQEVQPPEQVRAAFDDVIAAAQDGNRAVNEAEGYQNEILPDARAQATELLESASGYREAVVAEGTGAAERFKALVTEYRKAPEVTRQRLYLETMETILPGIEKIVIQDGTTSVLPYLPLGERGVAR